MRLGSRRRESRDRRGVGAWRRRAYRTSKPRRLGRGLKQEWRGEERRHGVCLGVATKAEKSHSSPGLNVFPGRWPLKEVARARRRPLVGEQRLADAVLCFFAPTQGHEPAIAMAAAGTSNVKMQEVRNGLARLERRRRKPQAGRDASPWQAAAAPRIFYFHSARREVASLCGCVRARVRRRADRACRFLHRHRSRTSRASSASAPTRTSVASASMTPLRPAPSRRAWSARRTRARRPALFSR